MDPRIERHPKFDNPKDLLEFAAEGENGLLSYIHSVGTSIHETEKSHFGEKESGNKKCQSHIIRPNLRI